MRKNMDDLSLRSAFPPMPRDCHDALMNAARSVQEEKKMKRYPIRTALVAVLLIIATMATAVAASRFLGWTDFVHNDVGVPQTAQQAMYLPESEYKVFELGPLTFTVRQMMCDGHIAVTTTQIKTADGSPALLTNEPYDPIGAFGLSTEGLIQRLGVDGNLTWVEAARQLGVPLYSVRAILDEHTYSGEEMEDPLWDENNDMSYFSMLYLDQGFPEKTLRTQMLLRVSPIDTETGEAIESETLRVREEIEIPIPDVLDTKTYAPEEPFSFNGFTLNRVEAEHTVAGLYVTSFFTCADEALRQTDDEDERWEAQRVLWSNLRWLDENGQPYPGGMNMSGRMDDDQWPLLSLEDMISVEETPETLILSMDGNQVTLR